MSLLTRVGDVLDRWLDRSVCVLGAVISAQAPEFLQQYLQRLGGHVDEARRILGQLLAAAGRSGQAGLEWASQAKASTDPVVADLGRVILNTHERAESLSAAQQALQDASAWERPWVFLRHVDLEVWRGTWAAYRPAVPTTGEGFIYAIAGMVIAWALYSATVRPACLRLLKARKGKAPN